ncbi:MAG: OmpA family protein [Bacteroidota bacterium]
MKTICFSTCFFLLWQLAFSQEERSTTVYFQTDKSELTDRYRQDLISFLDTLDKMRILQLEITGHTDNVASNSYNDSLSARRAKAVSAFFVSQGISYTLIQLSFNGEDRPAQSNQSPEGRQKNRRTDIRMWLAAIPAPIVLEDDPLPVDTMTIAEKDTCEGDTIIHMAGGNLLRTNRCSYLMSKDCISLTNLSDPQVLRQSSMTTMTRDKQPLISAGMIEIHLCEEINIEAACLIPVPTAACTDNLGMSLWTGRSDGTWEVSNQGFKIVTIAGQLFYEILLNRSLKVNLDKRVTRPSKIQLVTKGKLQLLEARLAFDCPNTVLKEKAYNRKRNKAKFESACPTSPPLLYAKVQNAQGDTLVLEYTPASNIKHRLIRGSCGRGKILKSFLGIKIREKGIYRTYILRPEDFEDGLAGK